MMTKEELAYLAGFFDGEGCITISRIRDKSGSLILMISNTNETIIKLIAKWFKGDIMYIKQKDNRKEAWTFKAYSQDAEIFLKAIYPYLLIKKEQAHIGLEYQKLIGTKGTRYNKIRRLIKNKILPTILKLREELFKQIRFLNRRGNLPIYS